MDEIQKVLVKAGRKDLAQKYYQKISGRYQPDISSTQRAIITLDEKDFKSKSFFRGLLDDLGLANAFYKKIKKFDSGDEPEPEIDFYERITLTVSKSDME